MSTKSRPASPEDRTAAAADALVNAVRHLIALGNFADQAAFAREVAARLVAAFPEPVAPPAHPAAPLEPAAPAVSVPDSINLPSVIATPVASMPDVSDAVAPQAQSPVSDPPVDGPPASLSRKKAAPAEGRKPKLRLITSAVSGIQFNVDLPPAPSPVTSPNPSINDPLLAETISLPVEEPPSPLIDAGASPATLATPTKTVTIDAAASFETIVANAKAVSPRPSPIQALPVELPPRRSNVMPVSNVFIRNEREAPQDHEFRRQVRGYRGIRDIYIAAGILVNEAISGQDLSRLPQSQQDTVRQRGCVRCGRRHFGYVRLADGTVKWGSLSTHGRACRCQRQTQRGADVSMASVAVLSAATS